MSINQWKNYLMKFHSHRTTAIPLQLVTSTTLTADILSLPRSFIHAIEILLIKLLFMFNFTANHIFDNRSHKAPLVVQAASVAS
ncbi:hypothetical protein BWZ29_20770 [Enterobacter cancerogenus]|jgi:hypothetical protein|nr:hypothetical protein BWZ29_20770 [Enterobacter cancerogenus]